MKKLLLVAVMLYCGAASAHTLNAEECLSHSRDAYAFAMWRGWGMSEDKVTEAVAKATQEAGESGQGYVKDAEDMRRVATVLHNVFHDWKDWALVDIAHYVLGECQGKAI